MSKTYKDMLRKENTLGSKKLALKKRQLTKRLREQEKQIEFNEDLFISSNPTLRRREWQRV